MTSLFFYNCYNYKLGPKLTTRYILPAYSTKVYSYRVLYRHYIYLIILHSDVGYNQDDVVLFQSLHRQDGPSRWPNTLTWLQWHNDMANIFGRHCWMSKGVDLTGLLGGHKRRLRIQERSFFVKLQSHQLVRRSCCEWAITSLWFNRQEIIIPRYRPIINIMIFVIRCHSHQLQWWPLLLPKLGSVAIQQTSKILGGGITINVPHHKYWGDMSPCPIWIDAPVNVKNNDRLLVHVSSWPSRKHLMNRIPWLEPYAICLKFLTQGVVIWFIYILSFFKIVVYCASSDVS